jgi:V8-like Glu-specific endopeptidase
VFFTEGNASYSCSGSAVDSAHGNLVLTAGHCVHGGGSRGSFVTDWIFFPGWTGPSDTPPLGAWTATDLFTTTLWSSAGGWDDDAGFAVVTGDIGRDTLEAELTIRSVTAPAISFGAAPVTGDVVTALGYPAAKKATGNVLSYCTGSVEVGLDGNGTIAMRCDMTAGSSGGPWFGPLQNTTGSTGTIRSLVSYSYPSMRGYLFGPILDAGEETAFVAASGAGDCGATAPVGYACADQAA